AILGSWSTPNKDASTNAFFEGVATFTFKPDGTCVIGLYSSLTTRGCTYTLESNSGYKRVYINYKENDGIVEHDKGIGFNYTLKDSTAQTVQAKGNHGDVVLTRS